MIRPKCQGVLVNLSQLYTTLCVSVMPFWFGIKTSTTVSHACCLCEGGGRVEGAGVVNLVSRVAGLFNEQLFVNPAVKGYVCQSAALLYELIHSLYDDYTANLDLGLVATGVFFLKRTTAAQIALLPMTNDTVAPQNREHILIHLSSYPTLIIGQTRRLTRVFTFERALMMTTGLASQGSWMRPLPLAKPPSQRVLFLFIGSACKLVGS